MALPKYRCENVFDTLIGTLMQNQDNDDQIKLMIELHPKYRFSFLFHAGKHNRIHIVNHIIDKPHKEDTSQSDCVHWLCGAIEGQHKSTVRHLCRYFWNLLTTQDVNLIFQHTLNCQDIHIRSFILKKIPTDDSSIFRNYMNFQIVKDNLYDVAEWLMKFNNLFIINTLIECSIFQQNHMIFDICFPHSTKDNDYFQQCVSNFFSHGVHRLKHFECSPYLCMASVSEIFWLLDQSLLDFSCFHKWFSARVLIHQTITNVRQTVSYFSLHYNNIHWHSFQNQIQCQIQKRQIKQTSVCLALQNTLGSYFPKTTITPFLSFEGYNKSPMHLRVCQKEIYRPTLHIPRSIMCSHSSDQLVD